MFGKNGTFVEWFVWPAIQKTANNVSGRLRRGNRSHGRWVIGVACIVLGLAIQNLPAADVALANLSKAPHADPIVEADAYLKAAKAITWRRSHQGFPNQSIYLLLQRDVSIKVGTYGFRADRALIRIDREHHPGRLIRHMSMYLDNARPLRGTGRVEAQAKRLLVTVSTTGHLHLSTDLLEPQNIAPASDLVTAGRERIARYRNAQGRQVLDVRPGQPLFDPQYEERRIARRRAIDRKLAEREAHIRAPVRPAPASDEVVRPDRPTTEQPTFVPVVVLDWQKWDYQPDDDGGRLMLLGGVTVTYEDYENKTAINLTCQNMVIFLDKESDYVPGTPRLNFDQMRGIYLEDNVVVTDGTYTIRAPRAYYDPSTQRAIVLDAVFYTWDAHRQIPIYVRADLLRQRSMRNWSGQQVVLTTSEFAEPHFSIATERITFSMHDRPDGSTIPHVSAKHLVPQVGTMPVGFLPGFEGDAINIPLRRTGVRYDDDLGAIIRSRWDVFGLLGRPSPDGVSMLGQIDYLGDHGPGLGINLEYDKHALYGAMDSYLVADDRGKDEIGGRTIDHDDDTRGFAHWQHRHDLGDDLELSVELGYVSDVTMLEEFDRGEAEASKPYETSIYLKHQSDDEALTLLSQYDLLNFTPQTTTLQAPGYTVEKFPEVGYYRVGTSLLDDQLTYYTETRASRMRIRTGRDSPRDRGFNDLESLLNFGILSDVDFDTAADAAGIPSSYVGRLDTRHEVQAPMKLDIVDVVPFIAGRATLYDDDFNKFMGESANERFWFGAGTRFHTSFVRTYESVEDRIFDLHRLRHIIEPSVELHVSHTTVGVEDLPVFDPDVESISEGTSTRFGFRNTLQTQRGGPGWWRQVDWLVVDTDLILRSDDADGPAEPPRYFPYRPEYSIGRDHFYSEVAWMISDTFAFRADATHSMEEDTLAQWHAGAQITHTPRLVSYLEYETIDAVNSDLLSMGLNYQLTRKYRLGVNQAWDLERHNTRRTEIIFERKLPRWTMLVVASTDYVDDDQSIGIVLIPDGIRSSKRLGPFGR